MITERIILQTVGEFLDHVEKEGIPRDAVFFDTGWDAEGSYRFKWEDKK